jgi:hypothetical protein
MLLNSPTMFNASAISLRMQRSNSFPYFTLLVPSCVALTAVYSTGSALLAMYGVTLAGKLPRFGMEHVPCASLIMSSTRTEMCGLFATLTHLRLIVEYFHIVLREKASCRIYCDSRAALARVDDKYYEDFAVQHGGVDSTTISRYVAIRTCLLQLPISIKWKWADMISDLRTTSWSLSW